MNVRELFEALSTLDPDKFVFVQDEGYAYELDLGDPIPLKKIHEGDIGSEHPDATPCYLLETWT